MVEQIYLAMRLAAGELLCGAEKLPVIFDEMFCAFDPERLKTAVLWLTESSGRQVIISTSKKQEFLSMRFLYDWEENKKHPAFPQGVLHCAVKK